MQRGRPRPRSGGYRVPFDVDPDVPSILARSGKNMAKDAEQYQAWGGGPCSPSGRARAGMARGDLRHDRGSREIPSLMAPEDTSRSKKLADIAQVPLLGE